MDAEIWIAISSKFVAICSLATSIKLIFVAKKHNLISVRPYLALWTDNREATCFSLNIINKGLGPAIIKSFTVKVGGETIEGHRGEMIKEALKMMLPDEIFDSTFEWMGKGYVMKIQEDIELFSLTFTQGTSLGEKEFLTNLARASSEINMNAFTARNTSITQRVIIQFNLNIKLVKSLLKTH